MAAISLLAVILEQFYWEMGIFQSESSAFVLLRQKGLYLVLIWLKTKEYSLWCWWRKAGLKSVLSLLTKAFSTGRIWTPSFLSGAWRMVETKHQAILPVPQVSFRMWWWSITCVLLCCEQGLLFGTRQWGVTEERKSCKRAFKTPSQRMKRFTGWNILSLHRWKKKKMAFANYHSNFWSVIYHSWWR